MPDRSSGVPTLPPERPDADDQSDEQPYRQDDGGQAVLPGAGPRSNSGGRNTERIPCAVHLNGKIEAMCCNQVGRSLKTKKTPEMN